MASDTASPSRDEVFDALKNLRRRYVLYYLQRKEGAVELGELAEQIAAWENDSSIAEVSSGERKSVYSALHQTHLPKLEAAGVLSYDPEQSRITSADGNTDLSLHLACDPHTSLPWHKLYLSLTAVSLLGLAPVAVGATPVGPLSGASYAVVVAAAFAAVAVAHTYDLYQWRQRTDGAAPDFVLELDG